jgi:hypothetical protein
VPCVAADICLVMHLGSVMVLERRETTRTEKQLMWSPLYDTGGWKSVFPPPSYYAYWLYVLCLHPTKLSQDSDSTRSKVNNLRDSLTQLPPSVAKYKARTLNTIKLRDSAFHQPVQCYVPSRFWSQVASRKRGLLKCRQVMELRFVAQNIDTVPVMMEWHEVMCAKRLVDFCNNVLITMLHTILSRAKEK